MRCQRAGRRSANPITAHQFRFVFVFLTRNKSNGKFRKAQGRRTEEARREAEAHLRSVGRRFTGASQAIATGSFVDPQNDARTGFRHTKVLARFDLHEPQPKRLSAISSFEGAIFPVYTNSWWARKDLNLGPTDYESAALTAELRAPRMLSRFLQATSDYTLLAFGGATMVDVPVFCVSFDEGRGGS